MIQTRELSKQYAGADYPAIDRLDLDIDGEGVFGVLGPNGAGKTTLISILTGLCAPTSGSYFILGSHHGVRGSALKRKIGIVPQEYALYPELTARENLNFFGSAYGMSANQIKESLALRMEEMGLSEFADRKIKHFSGGMKRRVNLIAGLLHTPQILFLDEPTVGVDVQSRVAILKMIRTLSAAGMGIIYSSHHLDEAEELCDNVMILDHGRSLCSGSPRDLIAGKDGIDSLEGLFLSLTGNALRDHA